MRNSKTTKTVEAVSAQALVPVAKNLAPAETAPAPNDVGTTTIKAHSPAPRANKKGKVARVPRVAIPMTSGKGRRQKGEKRGAKDATSKDRTPIAGTKPSKGPRKLSGLDAAATVLADAGKPLTSHEIVERMVSKNLWKTFGKTPHATIYAAIIREIGKRGDASRFRKTARGHFGFAGTKAPQAK